MIRLFLLIFGLGLFSSLWAEPVHLRLDPAKSVLYFNAQTTLHSVQGHVHGPRGEASVDRNDLKYARANLEFNADSLLTGVGMRDRKMREGFLDAAHYPKISFTMTSLAPLDSSRYELHGTLAIRGKEKAVIAPATVTPAPDSSSLTTRGRFQIRLSDFGIGRPRFLFDVMRDQADIFFNLFWVRQS